MKVLAIVRGATFVFVARVVGAVLTFLSQVLLARWTGAEQLGTYVFALSICMLLKTLCGVGLPAATIRFIGAGLAERRDDLILGFARRSLQVHLLVGVGIASVGVLIISVDGVIPTDLGRTLYAGFLIVPLFGLIDASSAIALGMSWVTAAVVPSVVFRTALFLMMVWGAWALSVPLTSSLAMTFHLAAILVVAVALALFIRARLGKRFPGVQPTYQTSLWLRTGAPLLLITLFTTYFLELNLTVAGVHLNPADLAIFGVSFRVAALISFGLFAVDAITLPEISRSHAADDSVAFRDTIIHASRLRFLGAVAFMVTLYFSGQPVLGLFGEEFVAGYDALLILAGAQVVGAAFGPTARVLSVTGLEMHCLKVFAVSLAALAALHPLLIEPFGLNGAAVAVLVVVSIQSIWLYGIVLRFLGVRAWAFARLDGRSTSAL